MCTAVMKGCASLEERMWHNAEQTSISSPNTVRLEAPLLAIATIALETLSFLGQGLKETYEKCDYFPILSACYYAVLKPAVKITATIIISIFLFIVLEFDPRKLTKIFLAALANYSFLNERAEQLGSIEGITPDWRNALVKQAEKRYIQAIIKAQNEEELGALHFLDTPESKDALAEEIKVKTERLVGAGRHFKMVTDPNPGPFSEQVLQAVTMKQEESPVYHTKEDLKKALGEYVHRILNAPVEEARQMCFTPSMSLQIRNL
jgi:hypothetical protein